MASRKTGKNAGKRKTNGSEIFADLSKRWLRKRGVSTGTMMGFPCLRADGNFFASMNRDATSLIVKLPAERVLAAIDADDGDAFAPNGRVFKEWLEVPVDRSKQWEKWLGEAHAFAAGSGS